MRTNVAPNTFPFNLYIFLLSITLLLLTIISENSEKNCVNAFRLIKTPTVKSESIFKNDSFSQQQSRTFLYSKIRQRKSPIITDDDNDDFLSDRSCSNGKFIKNECVLKEERVNGPQEYISPKIRIISKQKLDGNKLRKDEEKSEVIEQVNMKRPFKTTSEHDVDIKEEKSKVIEEKKFKTSDQDQKDKKTHDENLKDSLKKSKIEIYKTDVKELKKDDEFKVKLTEPKKKVEVPTKLHKEKKVTETVEKIKEKKSKINAESDKIQSTQQYDKKEKPDLKETKKVLEVKKKEEIKKDVKKVDIIDLKETTKVLEVRKKEEIVKDSKKDIKKVNIIDLKETKKVPEVKKKEEIEKDFKKDVKKVEKIDLKETKTVSEVKKKEDTVKDSKKDVKKVEKSDLKETKKVSEVKKKEETVKDSKKDVKKVERIDTKDIKKETQSKKTIEKLVTPKKEVKRESNNNEKTKQVVTKTKTKKKKTIKTTDRIKLTQRHFDRLYYSLPTFAPNYTRNLSPDCKMQGQLFLNQLRASKLWPLKMLDATAKIPSGVLHGNLNQLGDFDQCINISTKIKLGQSKNMHVNIQGKYCLIYIDIEAASNDVKAIVKLAQAQMFLKSFYEDPGHFAPRFSTIRFGLCIPSACNADDAKQIMYDTLRPYNHAETTGLRFHVHTNDDECTVKLFTRNYSFDNLNIQILFTVLFFVSILLLTLVSTLKDYLRESESKNTNGRILMCFSLRKTTKALLSDVSNSEISCIHGLRTICTLMLYLAHKLIPLGALPFSNRSDLTDLSNSKWSSLLRGSAIYTDSFLLISGVLSAYNMSNDMEKKGSVFWKGRLIGRYIRLTPVLLAVVLFYAYIFEFLGDGPLWNPLVVKNAEICKNHFWKNLLYIQNFFPFTETCATQTHQLALDMQLSLLSPILVWFWYKKTLFALLIAINLQILSFGLRYYFTTNYQLSLFIYHGISIKQLYRTADKSYSQAFNRAAPYVTGVCLGIILKDLSNRNFHMPKAFSLIGWLIAAYLIGWTFYTPAHMANRNYIYNIAEAVQFATLSPITWSLAISWIIFYCFMESNSFLNQILSSRFMILFSRISYSVYLVQFIIFFYNLGTVRTSSEFSILNCIDALELFSVIAVAIILTLTLDLPMQEIKSIFLSQKKVSFQETKVEDVIEYEDTDDDTHTELELELDSK